MDRRKKAKLGQGRYQVGYFSSAGRKVSAYPGLYIHTPFCRKKCDYCDFYSVSGAEGQIQKYTSALKKHLIETAAFVRTPIDTIYFGGGTPAMLGPKNLRDLLKTIQKNYQLGDNTEITVELNPESTNKKLLKALSGAGVNRLSIGIQTASDSELKALGRLHNFAEAKAAFKLARDMGFNNISVDLMYGIEGQTTESLESGLKEILNMDPEHISCYGLKVEENTPLWQRRDKTVLPGEDDQADMYLLVCDLLGKSGYSHYEISNFAKPGYESRHNLKYWRLDPYLGFGPAAHSDFDGKRYSNVREINAYIDGIENNGTVIDDIEEIQPVERATEFMMLRLRLKEGLDPAEYARRYSKSFQPAETKLREYEKMGYASYDGNWRLTEKGFLLSNTIIASLI